jgi:hypothetical protein
MPSVIFRILVQYIFSFFLFYDMLIFELYCFIYSKFEIINVKDNESDHVSAGEDGGFFFVKYKEY